MSHQRPSGLASGTTSLIGLIAPLLIYFLATPFLVHQLGAGPYGLLTLCLSMTSLLGSLDFGLGAGGVRAQGNALHLSQSQTVVRLHQELWSLFLYIGLGLAAIFWFGAPGVVKLLAMDQVVTQSDAVVAVRIVAAALVVAFATAAVSILPRALEQFPRLVMIQAGSGIALWGGAVALVLWGHGLNAVLLWALAVSSVVLALFIAWNEQLVKGLKWRPRLDLRGCRPLAAYSLYAFVGQISSTFTYHIDKFLIAYWLGPVPVAYYAVAVNLASKLLSLVAALTGFAFPRAVSLHAAGDASSLRDFYLRASRYTLLLVLPVLAPAVMLAKPMLELWLGSAFAAESAYLLQLLLIAYFLAVTSVVPSQIYNGMGNAKIGAGFAVIGSLINVLLCLVLIPIFGVIGAAVASIAAMAQAVVYMGTLEQQLGLGWLRAQRGLFSRLALLVSAQLSFLYVAADLVTGWMTLIAIGAAGWLLFYALWYLLGFLSAEDRELVTRLAGKWLS